MGSVKPIYERTVIHHGGRPITTECKKNPSEDACLTTVTVQEFERNSRQFDAAFSNSVFEHDRLLRYGDPLSPNCDLVATYMFKLGFGSTEIQGAIGTTRPGALSNYPSLRRYGFCHGTWCRQWLLSSMPARSRSSGFGCGHGLG
ncbi:MAG TPA: hypothetical protein DDZ51_02865 [Planctomycetaceae bacterium]|nr:hypothetical protein [Planctomycetaceae bacterium]